MWGFLQPHDEEHLHRPYTKQLFKAISRQIDFQCWNKMMRVFVNAPVILIIWCKVNPSWLKSVLFSDKFKHVKYFQKFLVLAPANTEIQLREKFQRPIAALSPAPNRKRQTKDCSEAWKREQVSVLLDCGKGCSKQKVCVKFSVSLILHPGLMFGRNFTF